MDELAREVIGHDPEGDDDPRKPPRRPLWDDGLYDAVWEGAVAQARLTVVDWNTANEGKLRAALLLLGNDLDGIR